MNSSASVALIAYTVVAVGIRPLFEIPLPTGVDTSAYDLPVPKPYPLTSNCLPHRFDESGFAAESENVGSENVYCASFTTLPIEANCEGSQVLAKQMYLSPFPNGMNSPPRETVSPPKSTSGASRYSQLSIGLERYASVSLSLTGA